MNFSMEFSLASDNSELIKEASDEAIARALEAIGFQAEGYAKLLCPVDTGRLQGSIVHETSPEDHSVTIGTNVEYAAYVELGTKRTKAQPYLRPAIENHIDEYQAMTESFLRGE